MDIIVSLLRLLLQNIFIFAGDWGVTIAAATFLIRLCLLPISIKQKVSIGKQQVLSKKMEEIKTKYKNDKAKLDQELAKLSSESAKTMLGCFVTLIQVPIMFSLYNVFLKVPMEVGSILVPWVANLKLPDAYFIIPLISTVIQLMPNLIFTSRIFKHSSSQKLPSGQMAVMAVVNLLFMAKAPVTIGIYWISSGLFNFLEQLFFNWYMKKWNAVNI